MFQAIVFQALPHARVTSHLARFRLPPECLAMSLFIGKQACSLKVRISLDFSAKNNGAALSPARWWGQVPIPVSLTTIAQTACSLVARPDKDATSCLPVQHGPCYPRDVFQGRFGHNGIDGTQECSFTGHLLPQLVADLQWR